MQTAIRCAACGERAKIQHKDDFAGCLCNECYQRIGGTVPICREVVHDTNPSSMYMASCGTFLWNHTDPGPRYSIDLVNGIGKYLNILSAVCQDRKEFREMLTAGRRALLRRYEYARLQSAYIARNVARNPGESLYCAFGLAAQVIYAIPYKSGTGKYGQAAACLSFYTYETSSTMVITIHHPKSMERIPGSAVFVQILPYTTMAKRHKTRYISWLPLTVVKPNAVEAYEIPYTNFPVPIPNFSGLVSSDKYKKVIKQPWYGSAQLI